MPPPVKGLALLPVLVAAASSLFQIQIRSISPQSADSFSNLLFEEFKIVPSPAFCFYVGSMFVPFLVRDGDESPDRVDLRFELNKTFPTLSECLMVSCLAFDIGEDSDVPRVPLFDDSESLASIGKESNFAPESYSEDDKSLDNVIATSCGLTAPPVGQGRSNLYPTIEEVRLMMERTAINQMNRAHAQARQIFRLKEARSKDNRRHKERDAELMRQREVLDVTFIGGSRKSRKHIAKGGLIGDKDGIARPVSFIRALPARK
ncbi:uncharacterized protein [Miscanthus floridulus]|uniref:uncharacterized protein n=1 Tax=Miscanthus floridulus TaxID=154761 RepID=UPI0034586F66